MILFVTLPLVVFTLGLTPAFILMNSNICTVHFTNLTNIPTIVISIKDIISILTILRELRRYPLLQTHPHTDYFNNSFEMIICIIIQFVFQLTLGQHSFMAVCMMIQLVRNAPPLSTSFPVLRYTHDSQSANLTLQGILHEL